MRKLLLSGVAGLALLAASMGVAKAADTFVAPDTAYDWSGFYLGGDIGYGEANFKGCIECEEASIADAAQLDLNGIAGGVHAGFNHQMDNNLVLGIEADVMFTDWNDNAGTTDVDDSQKGKVDLLGSVRGRLGLAMDRTLIYATGGVAFSDAEWTSIRSSDTDTAKLNGIGGVVGGGAEFMLTDNISLRGEGLYYFIGDKKDVSGFSEGSPGEHVEFDDAFVVRVGASIHFGNP